MTDRDTDALRIDKWLWAARFFKTRALAAQAVAGGKVKVNGERAKPAKAVRVGDALRIHIGVYEYAVEVLALAARRGPASAAALLYREGEASAAARKALSARLAADKVLLPTDDARPNKRVRRERIRFKQRQTD